ncbi:hypothetical protein BCR32DRAFT_274403 [Anaeromyces robustus]|uniref:Uncharacterized protein n=1 Tax=Anaeromyces robustus TaxID=1754192 RepID=A0A1Y1XPE2_9FUNG|nr:hypothetical protein BCR32DRAFT_274403 [Anaeromyces robustus]|eukprot:ORX87613.1 hypothetical protein BCR32DRAFT_274403 [Anaeromyces robustus]
MTLNHYSCSSMSETGCGKTPLIMIIAELKEIAIEILNNYAGIDDKGIIEFIIMILIT